MKQVTLTDGVVTAVDDLDDGVEVITTDAAPRLGSVRNGNGGWMAAGHAVLVDDDTGVVEQVSRNKWADEQAEQSGKTWHQTDSAPVPGQIRDEGGAYADPPPPPPSTDPAAYPLNRFQFEAMVLALGLSFEGIEQTIDGLPITDVEKAVAKSRLRNASAYNRDHPLIAQLAAAMDLTDDDVDAAWLQAKDIA